jgi:hypothetical protein
MHARREPITRAKKYCSDSINPHEPIGPIVIRHSRTKRSPWYIPTDKFNSLRINKIIHIIN